ncbi:hypothetical protein PR048_007568 [Dryococelus australis]|uniref:Uncharacterized protein n=1 Tax=Dryococelus australis TaxID=614101 RepID=A0ABQ9HVH3_9NEOP|nr:hypothetical protein PR048_007568 [Dryococelus australis]
MHEYKDLENTVFMLGSFHTLMNFVDVIGTLMKGSGLNEVLQEIYGANAVLHMMSGKAISRAIRGHMLVHAALSTLFVADMFPCNEYGSCFKIIKDASTLYDSIMSGKESVANVATSDSMCETSKLWLAYQEKLQTVRKLIATGRTSSWKLHLEAIQECLVIVAVAGYHNYLKSGYKYLQDMLQLPSDKPSVYELFQKG